MVQRASGIVLSIVTLTAVLAGGTGAAQWLACALRHDSRLGRGDGEGTPVSDAIHPGPAVGGLIAQPLSFCATATTIFPRTSQSPAVTAGLDCALRKAAQGVFSSAMALALRYAFLAVIVGSKSVLVTGGLEGRRSVSKRRLNPPWSYARISPDGRGALDPLHSR